MRAQFFKVLQDSPERSNYDNKSPDRKQEQI